jgi:hypothetical protein
VTNKDKVENLLTEDLKNNGFTKMKKYFEMLELKFGFYYSYQEIKSILQEFCNKHNYIMERTYDKKKYPKNGTAILIFDNLKCKPF